MFLNQDYAISEAQIGYVEVPKVALLRTLAGLIGLLWSLEWAIRGRAFQDDYPSISIQTLAGKLRPSKVMPAFNDWLKVHPTRWLLLAAGLFFGSTLLSTVLSGSLSNSMWGEIPGQDGYSAYTIASYGVLFGVIATHLKSPVQFNRLLAAVVLMGCLVGLYGILQHYGHDFLDLTETTGGGSARVTIFMGNAIFAGAVLAMTVPVTLVAAAINLHGENHGNWWPFSKLGLLTSHWVFTSLWALVLSVQLIGLMFTFSRGPWVGTVLALVAFLVFVVLSSGWRLLVRTGLVLGLAGVFVVSFLHWQGSVSIVNLGPWLGIIVASMGLAGAFGTLFVIKNYGRTIVLVASLGAAVTIAGAAVFGPSALSDRGAADPTGAGTGGGSTAGQVVGRITSIKTDVLGGFAGGRGTHWKVSWKLIKDRPWFAFDELHFAWLRPLVGYGPDLFRYTYLLESPVEGRDFRILEPDQAHNFFIHQTVEQGIFGGLASVALFASVFGVAAHHLLRRRRSTSPFYNLLLLGLTAVVLGRSLEMMVGVARISDLTVLWVVFGLFAASTNLTNKEPEAAAAAVSQPSYRTKSRDRRRARRVSAPRPTNPGLVWRLAVVAWLIGVIGVVTWQKGVNPVRASVAEGQALKYFQAGDLTSTVEKLDKAIRLAPGVPNYYNNRAQIFLAYQLRPDTFTEPGCEQQTEMPYLVCLGFQSFESNLESVKQQPFNYRARLAAGNSAFNLRLYDSAIESYSTAASMVPNAYLIWNDLAESRIDAEFYAEALSNLDRSLEITGDSEASRIALLLKSRALRALGQLEEALKVVNRGLLLGYTPAFAQARLDIRRDIVREQDSLLDIGYFDKIISQDPQDAAARYLRGLAHLALGDAESAGLDIGESYDLGLVLDEVLANRGYARLKINDLDGAGGDLSAVMESTPDNALFDAYFGEYLMARRSYADALDRLKDANALNPDLGLAYLVRSKVYLALGQEGPAKEALETSQGLDLPSAPDYVDRGGIHAFFGDRDLAFSDLNEAVRINPSLAKYYNSRAKGYARFGDFQSAIADLDDAIQRNPQDAEYFVNRGVVYDILGETDRASADFATARSLDEVEIPPPDDRDSSYFAVYTGPTSN
ncbi:MAG: tetratricopeptide repeat protein [Chloroflexi bacterium]|nr:tetratricopeptide repeat protein [Chloroflexota bacterium]